MYCKQCGNELEEGVVICQKCGANNEEKTVENKSFSEKLKNNKKMQYGIIGGIAAVVLLIILIVVFTQSKKTINLEDYAKIEITGCNTKGTASIEFDYDKFTQDVIAITKEKSVDNVSWEDLFDLYWLEDSFDMELDKTEGLSNGDKVTLTFTYNNKTLKSHGIKFKGNKITSEVKGLEEIKTVDPFKNISVEFSGVDGQVEAVVVNSWKDNYLDTLSCSLDKNTGISVGDTVTVTINASEENAANNGYAFKKTTKKFTCESADSYMNSLSQLNEKDLEKIKSQCVDVIKSQVGTSNTYVIDELQYEGEYLLINKQLDTYWHTANKLYLVYSTTISSKKEPASFETQKAYIVVGYEDILVKENGDIECDLSEGKIIRGYDNFEGTWYSFEYGFLNGTSMYETIIQKNLTDYTYEISENLQQFGN